MVFRSSEVVMNLTPVGYIASPSGGTGRGTGKISPSIGSADCGDCADAIRPAEETFRNSRRIMLSPCTFHQATIASSNSAPAPRVRRDAARAWLHDAAAAFLPPVSECRPRCSRFRAVHWGSSGCCMNQVMRSARIRPASSFLQRDTSTPSASAASMCRSGLA